MPVVLTERSGAKSGIQMLKRLFSIMRLRRRSCAPIKLEIDHGAVHEAKRS